MLNCTADTSTHLEFGVLSEPESGADIRFPQGIRGTLAGAGPSTKGAVVNTFCSGDASLSGGVTSRGVILRDGVIT